MSKKIIDVVKESRYLGITLYSRPKYYIEMNNVIISDDDPYKLIAKGLILKFKNKFRK